MQVFGFVKKLIRERIPSPAGRALQRTTTPRAIFLASAMIVAIPAFATLAHAKECKNPQIDLTKKKGPGLVQKAVGSGNDVEIDLLNFALGPLALKTSYTKDFPDRGIVNNMYAVVDEWQIEDGIFVGRVIEGLQYDRYADRKLVHVRFFNTREEAAGAAAPHLDANVLPTSAAALECLEPYEMVMVPTQMAVVTGLNVASGEPISAYAGLSKAMIGTFRVHVLKLSKDLVRLRVTARHANRKSAGAGLRFFDLKLLGHTVIGKRIASGDFWNNHGAQISFDYTFNLHNPDGSPNQEVYDAINEILDPVGNRKMQWKMYGGNQSDQHVMESLRSSTEKAQVIADREADSAVDRAQRAVIRNFALQELFGEKGRDFRFGIKPAYARAGKMFHTGEVSFTDGVGQTVDFWIPTLRLKDEYKLGFGVRGAKSEQFSALIARKDRDAYFNLGDYYLRTEMRDEIVSKGEKDSLINRYKRNLPEAVRSKIGLEDQLLSSRLNHARLYLRVVINEKYLSGLYNISFDELVGKFNAYLETHQEILPEMNIGDKVLHTWEVATDAVFYPIRKLLHIKPQVKLHGNSWVKAHEDDILKVLRTVYEILNLRSDSRAGDNEMRREAFVALRSSNAWRELGTGFLISLLPQEQLADAVQAKVVFHSNESPTQDFEKYFGNPAVDNDAQILELIQLLLGQGSFDLTADTFGDLRLPVGQPIDVNNFTNQVFTDDVAEQLNRLNQ